MSDPMIAAQVQQAREVATRAHQERETCVRLIALLVRAIETETEGALMRVDGKIAVRLAALADVPKRYRVNVQPANVKDSEDPNAAEIPVLVVDVADAAPQPTLVVPNGNGRIVT